ncbi:Glutaredoxin [hydrothermal vent metagenome]|uniref:Glutaredoxin n=1 Tax=hydrothermal vent metagenome TaxID=652676 RepID=A0A3B0X8A2_9ZZZZ
MLLKLLREGLGRLIVLISYLTPLRPLNRSAEEQKCVDQTVASMSIYQFYACPFCIKTRRALKRLDLSIEMRDAQTNPARAELLAGGGEIKVPCLRIDNDDGVTWMYESSDIIAYLEQQFGETSSPCNEISR